jgi:hypothetical protein
MLIIRCGAFFPNYVHTLLLLSDLKTFRSAPFHVSKFRAFLFMHEVTTMNYREIDFSVADNNDGTWRWALHPKIESPGARTVPTGQVTGGQAEATIAAQTAIAAWLDRRAL